MAVSVGVAVYPDDGMTFGDLMRQADIVMYRSKGTGRGTSITEQPGDDVGEDDMCYPSAASGADSVHKRDLFVRHGKLSAVRVPEDGSRPVPPAHPATKSRQH
jgi:predicted signal transduction protein with EAL and GGDEF domain